MTSRFVTLMTPAALLLTAALLSGCSAPATDGADTTGESTDTNVESPAPSEAGADLGLPAQTVGSDTDCSFMSNEQIAAIWGFDVATNDASMVQDGGTSRVLYGCNYNQSDDGTGLTIDVAVREFVDDAGATQFFADALSGAEFDGEGGLVIEPVSGVGEEAGVQTYAELVGTPENLNEILIVRVGTLIVEIGVTDIINGVKTEYRELLVETYRAGFES